jgi:hypothetical protein
MTTSNYSQMEDLDWDVLGKCAQMDLSQLEGCRRRFGRVNTVESVPKV